MPLVLLVLLIVCPKYGLKQRFCSLPAQPCTSTHIHTHACVCGWTRLCRKTAETLFAIYTYCCLICIREYTLSYESISINLHYFPFFYIILPCGFKVTLLFLLVSSLSFCKPLGPSQGRSGGDNLFFTV